MCLLAAVWALQTIGTSTSSSSSCGDQHSTALVLTPASSGHMWVSVRECELIYIVLIYQQKLLTLEISCIITKYAITVFLCCSGSH